MICIGGPFHGYYVQDNVDFPTIGIRYQPAGYKDVWLLFYWLGESGGKPCYCFLSHELPVRFKSGWYLPCAAFSHNIYPDDELRQDSLWHDRKVKEMLSEQKQWKVQWKRGQKQRRRDLWWQENAIIERRQTMAEVHANIMAFVAGVMEYDNLRKSQRALAATLSSGSGRSEPGA